MTKKLTPTEKFNNKIKRIQKELKGYCEGVECNKCILNNYGPNENHLERKYNHTCGLAGVRDVLNEYIDNHKVRQTRGTL